jgi:hypothetical protein
MKIIQSIEDVLMEKIVLQKQIIIRYREIEQLTKASFSDESIQMSQCFGEIDSISDKMIELDLMFSNYFDQFKRAMNIKSLDELDQVQQKSFSLIQQLVAKVNSLQDQINSLKELWAETEISLKRTKGENRQKQKVSAAYKNINKL